MRLMGRYNFLLMGMAFSVILGLIIVETPKVITLEFALPRYRTIWLALTILMFVEFFVVFNTVFLGLKIPYRNIDLFLDLGLGLWFAVIVVHLIASLKAVPACYVKNQYLCSNNTVLLGHAVALLLAANLRIGLLYHKFKATGGWTNQRNKFLSRIHKKPEHIFRYPVLSNFSGAIFCGLLFVVADEGVMANGYPLALYISCAGFFVAIGYYLFRHPPVPLSDDEN